MMISTRSNAAGSSLIETLIALLVLTVGLIALLGVLARGISALAEVTWQSRAIRHAESLGELIALLPPDSIAASPAPIAIDCDIAYRCTPQELLSSFAYQWQQRIAMELPSGLGTYRVSTMAGSRAASVELTWQDQWGRPAQYRALAALRPALSSTP